MLLPKLEMTVQSSSYRKLFAAILFTFSINLATSEGAEEWIRVGSKDGKISALFPNDIRKDLQTQTDRTIAGKVRSNFGEFHGDGIILAGSASDLPRLAIAAKAKMVFESSKKTFLEQAKGTQISFKETTVRGVAARELLYKGEGYQGKGDPYQGRAVFIIVNKRMYILNSVVSKATVENKAAEKKLFDSVRLAE